MREVRGKTAFVTGGASGMGLAMVRSFARAGMKVVAADVEQAALDAVQAEFESANVEFLALKVDVTDRDAMEQAAADAEARFEKIHVLCNNAGVAVGGPIDQMAYNDWDWVVGVNLGGVVNGLQAFLPRIKAHGEGGHIVNTASMAGHLAIPGLSVYTATKFAVVGISETMRADLASDNVGVSVLCPGIVNTNIFTSERNRPAALPGTDFALLGDANAPEAEQAARLAELQAGALDPAIVGDMVLHAIREDEFYIFSHPELKPMADARQDELAGAYARWQAYREERGV